MRLTTPITRLLYLLVIVSMLVSVFVLHTVESNRSGDTYALRGAEVREEHAARSAAPERVDTRAPLYRNTAAATNALRASTTLESTEDETPNTTTETTVDEPADDEPRSDDTPVEENTQTEVAQEVIVEETPGEIPVAIETEEPEPSEPAASEPVEPQDTEPVEPLVLSSSLSISEIMLLLNTHNEARKKVGIAPLTWSPTLAASAQTWADELQSESCKWHHGDTEYGENIFYSWSSDDSFRRNADEPVFWWLNKSQYYDYETNECEPGEICGHYTQVVWAESRELGCGRVYCDDGKYHEEVWVCQYNPPGNVIGEQPY